MNTFCPKHMTTIHLTINNTPHTLEVPPMKRLLDVLREDLAPNRHERRLRRRRVRSLRHPLQRRELANSCLIPALQANNATITTIEGLAPKSESTPGLYCLLLPYPLPSTPSNNASSSKAEPNAASAPPA